MSNFVVGTEMHKALYPLKFYSYVSRWKSFIILNMLTLLLMCAESSHF